MGAIRRLIGCLAVAAFGWLGAADAAEPRAALRAWYGLSLELVRHTPTYSPPVASRAFGYLGVTAYEAVASGSDKLAPLAGQLNGLAPGPARQAGAVYDEAVVIQAAMAAAAQDFFANTGPTGQRAMAKLAARLGAEAAEGVPADVAARSEAHGRAVAAHILGWSRGDGGAVIENLGFPAVYEAAKGPARWVPTSAIALQQTPLLPAWGNNRTFAMPHGAACPLPPPPAYSEEKDSQFFKEALEVFEARKTITPEKRAIARFWSDDPMLSPTPPGHWQAIALQVLAREDADLEKHADVLARLGVALADAFIGCWKAKFEFDLLRPVTYIRRFIDPDWESLLTTPPFPEYPSGHSTQSAAAAAVLTAVYGEAFAFEDETHKKDGLPARAYPGFNAAAEEAGISRLYGGIHFRAAIERGLDQGRCIGAHAVALRTRR
jgi:PAP2 superfamily